MCVCTCALTLGGIEVTVCILIDGHYCGLDIGQCESEGGLDRISMQYQAESS